MEWKFDFQLAQEDMDNLDGSLRKQVMTGFKKLKNNPLHYGKQLGHKNDIDLSGCRELKFKQSGIRVIYRVSDSEHQIVILAVGPRADFEVFRVAESRILKTKNFNS